MKLSNSSTAKPQPGVEVSQTGSGGAVQKLLGALARMGQLGWGDQQQIGCYVSRDLTPGGDWWCNLGLGWSQKASYRGLWRARIGWRNSELRILH